MPHNGPSVDAAQDWLPLEEALEPIIDPIERGALALFELDCERSIPQAVNDYVWDRVKPEYMRRARAVLDAAKAPQRGA